MQVFCSRKIISELIYGRKCSKKSSILAFYNRAKIKRRTLSQNFVRLPKKKKKNNKKGKVLRKWEFQRQKIIEIIEQ